MKIRSIYAIATVLTLVAAIGAPSATAQMTDLRAEIPFEFYAAGKLLPAGTYVLSQLNPTTLRLRDSGGNAVFISAGREDAGPAVRSWFLFNQYGKRSFLAGAYWSGSSVSLKVPASRGEQEVARTEGQRSPITIAAR